MARTEEVVAKLHTQAAVHVVGRHVDVEVVHILTKLGGRGRKAGDNAAKGADDVCAGAGSDRELPLGVNVNARNAGGREGMTPTRERHAGTQELNARVGGGGERG